MQWIKIIFQACNAILNIKMNLCGYSISLWQAMIYGFLIYVLGRFIFNLFD